MKTINQVIATTFPLENVTDSTIIGAQRGDSKFQLVYESDGYIFRNFTDDFRSGHSGSFFTKQQATKEAMLVSETEVYQFDSHRELYEWLLK